MVNDAMLAIWTMANMSNPQPKFSKIKIEMLCLFPDFDTKKCCENKWKQSCSPTLAKTIHKYRLHHRHFYITQTNKQMWKKFFGPKVAKTIHKYYHLSNGMLNIISVKYYNHRGCTRFINKDGEKFVEQFLPEISSKFGAIIQDLLNR